MGDSNFMKPRPWSCTETNKCHGRGGDSSFGKMENCALFCCCLCPFHVHLCSSFQQHCLVHKPEIQRHYVGPPKEGVWEGGGGEGRGDSPSLENETGTYMYKATDYMECAGGGPRYFFSCPFQFILSNSLFSNLFFHHMMGKGEGMLPLSPFPNGWDSTSLW